MYDPTTPALAVLSLLQRHDRITGGELARFSFYLVVQESDALRDCLCRRAEQLMDLASAII